MKRVIRPPAISPFLQFLATLALTVLILHVGRPVLVPIALAVLLVFVLTPLVKLLTRNGLSRTPAIVITLVLFLAALGGTSWLVAMQATSLARELPQHKERMKAKIAGLQQTSGPFGELLQLVDELANPKKASATAAKPTGPAAAMAAAMPAAAPGSMGVKPPEEPVVVARLEEHAGVVALAEGLLPFIEPLVSIALVAILVVFLLFNREDMRNRFIGLFGYAKLTGTTRMLSDASDRVGKFLLMQLLINIGFGVLLAAGLAILGVKYFLLWGVLSTFLRFIPFVGTWISALFPMAICFATTDGWSQTLMVFGYFVVLDVLTGQIIEPIVLGRHTGISPVALLVAAAFWAWLWGPVGLVLSTPITACLAVIGQHIPRLRPLAVLLDDRPAMAPSASLYQRLLANDHAEAKSLMKETTSASGEAAAFDQLFVPALTQLRLDRQANEVTEEEETSILDAFEKLVETAEDKKEDAPSSAPRGVAIGIPARHRVDELPLRMLAKLLPREDVGFETLTSKLLLSEIEAKVLESRADCVVVGQVAAGGMPQASYLCRRLAKRFPELRIIVARLGAPADQEESSVHLRRLGATMVVDSLEKAAEHTGDAIRAAADERESRARRFPAA